MCMLNQFQSYSDIIYSLILKQALYLSQKTENSRSESPWMACEHLRNEKIIIGHVMVLHGSQIDCQRWPNARQTVGPPSGQPDKRYFSWHLVGPAVGQTLMLNDAMLGQRRAYTLAQRVGDLHNYRGPT